MAKKKTAKLKAKTKSLPNELIALAFSKQGELLASARPEGDKLYFDIKPEPLRYARVFVFPEPPGGIENITLAAAERLQAYEPAMQLGPDNELDLSRIPDQLIRRWLWYRCCARGRVTKRFLVDGMWQDMPVCNAIVHICEVDPILIVLPRIPDWVIERLRDVLLERIPLPFPDPFPDPPPFREFVPIPPQPFDIANRMRPIGGLQPDIARLAAPRIELPQEVRLQLSNAGPAQARNLLAEHIGAFRPYLCLLPWFWPWLYRCDEITTVRTDFNGRFEACFWRQILEEQADLYFWVEYEIDGVPTTVYHPPIPCNTYWDYTCGTEVSIRITDPRVPFGCHQPLAGQVAWVKTIGWGAHVSRIEQHFGAGIVQQGRFFSTVGLTDYATGGLSHGLAGQKVRPFARQLRFIVQFGSGFPDSSVTHYRWSYRKTHNDKLVPASASEQAWTPVDDIPVSKAYTIEVAGPGGVTTFHTGHHPLGPFPVGSLNAYRIPPVSPKGPDVANDPTAEWDQNTTTIIVDSTSLKGDGLYEFKLEFFNAAGVRQNVADTVNQVSDPANLGNSQPAGSPFLLPASEDPFKPFRMKVRIDNQKSTAQIYTVLVDGVSSSTECGFVQYKDKGISNVNFRLRASHPNDFATFSFNVARGNSADPLSNADTSGMVGASAANYTLGADDIYRNAVNVGYLLGTCPDKAAFAEHLYVNGLHTNGTSILDDFDASALAAFALEPE
ncbi:MAG: hypothetical protein KDD19_09095 [Phaeodactylibacter sp.]|nr:hypothetical protein [Phaeodactylibacter sp.]MCB9051694.1 hypothetical protein [Lewinellaceae bacterium]